MQTCTDYKESSTPLVTQLYLMVSYAASLRYALAWQSLARVELVIESAKRAKVRLPLDDALYRAVCMWQMKKNSRRNFFSSPCEQSFYKIIKCLIDNGATLINPNRHSLNAVSCEKRKALLNKLISQEMKNNIPRQLNDFDVNEVHQQLTTFREKYQRNNPQKIAQSEGLASRNKVQTEPAQSKGLASSHKV